MSIDKPRGHAYRRTNHAVRAAVVMTALGCLLAQGNAVLHAESGNAALVISKDGANVNVSLDSQTGSDVSIRRSDDLMMIKVPRSFPAKLVIDPSLKKDEVVQETETETGKTILIHSQQIYLMTRENLQENAAKSVSEPSKRPTETGVRSGALDTESRKAQPFAAARSTSPAADRLSISGSKPKTQQFKPPTIPLNIPSILSAPEPAVKESPPAQKNEKASPGKPSAKATKADTAPTPQPALETKPASPADPELLPIDLSGRQQATATQQSTGLMIRVTLSLVAVLLLLIGFIQVVLPKLMERYPDFFENLRQQARLKQGSLFAGTDDAPEPIAPRRRSPKRQFNAPVQYKPDSKRRYLEKMDINGSRLSVLSSSPLGKGSELHLVEVQGRQLVIATTPYTVSFVKELTEPAFAEAAPPAPAFYAETLQADSYSAAPMASIAPATIPSIPEPAWEDAVEPMTQPAAPLVEPAQTTTIAYLSDDSPMVSVPPQPAKKPYASVARTVRQASVGPPASPPAAKAGQPAHRAIHQKYLDANPPGATPTEMALEPSPTPPMPAAAPYVDAEEVIVLEDYDDVYGD